MLGIILLIILTLILFLRGFPVPDDVLRGPNHNSSPVAWWFFQDGKLQICCYAPGGGF